MEVRTALVTGAAQGIGEAIARSLFDRGCRVVLADLQADRAAERSVELDPRGERAVAVELDVSEKASVERAVEEAVATFGRLDILVNNAALSVMRPLWEIEQEEWDRVLAVNLRGALFGIQAAAPAMRERGWGRIVNLSSLAGQQGGVVMGAHYAASKAGILVLTKIAAAELASSGVTVNAVAPAAIDGPLMRSLGEERIAALEERIPVGRIGRPEEVGALVAFLASEDAGYINGTTYDINGGQFLR